MELLESGSHLFLTGKAGTGKSTLVRHFLATTERRVVVAAPTGIAALNVEGYTIHRLFGFRPTTTLDDVRSGTYRPGRFTKAIRGLQTLVVDEASMVRADVFDMVEAALRRFGPREGEPFGGVQVVLVGDLLQLPPIVGDREAEFFRTHYETEYFYSAHSFERDAFPTVALTTVFRQLGDDRLTSLLNAVREGVLLEAARAELNTRVDADFEPPEDELWLTLAPSNSIVTSRNRQRLERLAGDVVTHVARESGDVGGFDPPTDAVLHLKVGAQIMLLTNDPSDRWVNGSLGRIVDMAMVDGERELDVELADGSVVTVGAYTWEVTRPVVDGGSLSREVVGTYTQLPCRLAWAITIHKSQGQTLDRLVVDLTGGVFATGQVYVALSRATSMAGLVLRKPIEPRHLRTDRRVTRFLSGSVARTAPDRFAALGVCFVGDEGTFSRPRPIELAVAFDDGTAVSTLVNPERDLADARSRFAVTADDVLLAPTLPEAWAVLAPLLEGVTPVGVRVDDALAKVDFELKRLQHVVPMPFGVEVPYGALSSEERVAESSGRAAARARAALAAFMRLREAGVALASSTPFEPAESLPDPSYLLTRDPDLAPPSTDRLPTLSALVEASTSISAALLDGAQTVASSPPPSVVAEAVAARLANVATKASRLSPQLIERLRTVEDLLGERFVDELVAAVNEANPSASDVLQPGARVCFTGTATSPSGRLYDRDEMERLARDAGLVPASNVTKTKCDLLVVAEIGTQSGKARKARDYGKPVISADEFFAWVGVD
ncbi:MAG: AAA family ATPase [Microbacterium sp.]|nr:MAG: AAA family ATPase [Microbacterium sp.]